MHLRSAEATLRRRGLRRTAGSLAFAASLLAATAASAGVIVFASGPSAPQFPIGKKVDGNERIVLRPADRIRILEGAGTRELRGPGTYSLDQQPGGANQRSSFAVLTEQRSSNRVRTGAARGFDATPPNRSPNLWLVDVARPGNVCIPGVENVRLWRAAPETAATFTFAGGGGPAAKVAFDEGASVAAWDASAPLADGNSYSAVGPDGTQLGMFKFTVLAAPASDPEALAEQLIELGCLQQLEVLADTLMSE